MELIDEFLPARLRETKGARWEAQTPYLGVAGIPNLGNRPAQYLIGKSISDDDFRKYEEGTATLRKFATSQQLFDIARLNHREYSNTINQLQTDYSANYILDWQRVSDMVVDVNLRLLNFLCAFRTYLDHTEARLKRQEGESSTHFQSFRQACVDEFDNCFSYRFVYRLRNYTQHCGMPLGRVASRSDLEDVSTGQSSHEIDFYFERDYLLSNFDSWGAVVKPDLEAMPPQFPITSHIDESMECLQRIDEAVIQEAKQPILASLADIKALLSEVEGQPGCPCVYTTMSIEVNSEGRPIANTNIQRLPMQLIGEVERVFESRHGE